MNTDNLKSTIRFSCSSWFVLRCYQFWSPWGEQSSVSTTFYGPPLERRENSICSLVLHHSCQWINLSSFEELFQAGMLFFLFAGHIQCSWGLPEYFYTCAYGYVDIVQGRHVCINISIRRIFIVMLLLMSLAQFTCLSCNHFISLSFQLWWIT